MNVSFTSPDLKAYVAQLRAIGPEVVQSVSAEALRASMPTYVNALRSLLPTSEKTGRRRRLKGTARGRIWIRRKHAPNALLKVYTRVTERPTPTTSPPGLRLLFLDKGTVNRYTGRATATRLARGGRKAARRFTGRVEPRNIIDKVDRKASGPARVIFEETFVRLARAALTYKGGGRR